MDSLSCHKYLLDKILLTVAMMIGVTDEGYNP
jgi:hypothetical protein